jgi:hypothetical protein
LVPQCLFYHVTSDDDSSNDDDDDDDEHDIMYSRYILNLYSKTCHLPVTFNKGNGLSRCHNIHIHTEQNGSGSDSDAKTTH